MWRFISRARNEAGLCVKPGGKIQTVNEKTTDLLGVAAALLFLVHAMGLDCV